MSDDRTWCYVSSQGIEEFNLTRHQAKAKCSDHPEYRPMLTEDAEELFDEQDAG